MIAVALALLAVPSVRRMRNDPLASPAVAASATALAWERPGESKSCFQVPP
jgi:hypothetical protein